MPSKSECVLLNPLLSWANSLKLGLIMPKSQCLCVSMHMCAHVHMRFEPLVAELQQPHSFLFHEKDQSNFFPFLKPTQNLSPPSCWALGLWQPPNPCRHIISPQWSRTNMERGLWHPSQVGQWEERGHCGLRGPCPPLGPHKLKSRLWPHAFRHRWGYGDWFDLGLVGIIWGPWPKMGLYFW